MNTVTVYGLLLLTVVAETCGTSCLTASRGFSRLLPSLGAVASYLIAYFCFSNVLKYLPMGIAYSIWCGCGIVLICLAGVVFFGQHLDLAACTGIAFIIAGVVIINLFSDVAGH